MADIEVKFLLPPDGREITVELDETIRPAEVINELLSAGALNANPNGYLLALKGGDFLEPHHSLSAAGVAAGSVVRVVPAMDAGGVASPADLMDAKFRPDIHHELYLTASGNLTQLNAIMAAILTAGLAATTRIELRIAVCAALSLHAIAALILCWAAKPHQARKTSKRSNLGLEVASHSFRFYQLGWHATMLGMIASAATLLMFAWIVVAEPRLPSLEQVQSWWPSQTRN